MTRRDRRETLETLFDRPTPWTPEQWREWAAVAAADHLDRTGDAFSVAGNLLVVGPFGDPFTREVGGRAASWAETIPLDPFEGGF